MKKSIARLSLLSALALLLVACLMATAGAALAGSPFEGQPPGSQWGGHEINGKYYFSSPTEATVVASDPRVCGTLVLVIEVADELTPNGNYRYAGSATLTSNDGGIWTYPHWEGLFSSQRFHPQFIGFTKDATGSGGPGYDGMILRSADHSGGGDYAPFILKGWIVPAE
jgi:hypothetical protein